MPQRDDLIIEWPWLPKGPFPVWKGVATSVGFVVGLCALLFAPLLFASLFEQSVHPLPQAIQVLVGVGLGIFGYWLLTMSFNRSRVALVANELHIDHGPLPWPGCGRKRLRIDRVEQFYVDRVEHWSSSIPNSPSSYHDVDDGPVYVYWLTAIDPAYAVHERILKLHKADEAVFLEQTLEDMLGIADKPVAGEMDPSITSGAR